MSATYHHGFWQRSLVRTLDAYWELQARQLARIHIHPEWVNTRHGRVRLLVGERRQPGPTWLFIHGFSSQGLDWTPLLQAMQPHCPRLVAIDLPGHGRSPPGQGYGLTPEVLLDAAEEAIRAYLAAPDGGILVGNSMGGLVAVKMAQRLQALIHGMVLISPYGAPYSDAVLADLVQTFTVHDRPEAYAFVRKLFPNGVPPPGIAVAALCMRAHLNRPHLVALKNSAFKYPRLTPEDLNGMPPTLLIWGTSDTIMPRAGLEFFRRALPPKSTQVITPSRFSHMPFLDLAPEVTGHILGWAKAAKLLMA